MSIILKEDFTSYVDVGGLSTSKVEMIVGAVNKACLRIMKRKQLHVTDDYFPRLPFYSTALFLNWPRITLTSVWEDFSGYYGQPSNAFAASTQLTLGTDFVYDTSDEKSPLVRIDGSLWSNVPGTVKVVYEYGWASPPDDMRQAALRLTALAWDSRFREGGLASETFGRYSYDLLAGSSGTGDRQHDSDLMAIRRTLRSYALEA